MKEVRGDSGCRPPRKSSWIHAAGGIPNTGALPLFMSATLNLESRTSCPPCKIHGKRKLNHCLFWFDFLKERLRKALLGEPSLSFAINSKQHASAKAKQSKGSWFWN